MLVFSFVLDSLTATLLCFILLCILFNVSSVDLTACVRLLLFDLQ